MNDLFMTQALDAAFTQIGFTSPNPAVGAVLVKNGNVVGTGSTCVCGGDHAEVCAIKSAGVLADGAELFVTLEPCCHFGKTPPCTDAIIRAGIKKVYFAAFDPNPVVQGKGVAALNRAGVETVSAGDRHNAAARDLIRNFDMYISRKRPFVIHKSAMTLDGRIATREHDSNWISSLSARLVTHRLRSLADGIVVGAKTVMIDNPSLNTRFADFDTMDMSVFEDVRFNGTHNFLIEKLFAKSFTHQERSPVRYVIGLPEKLSKEMNIFYDERVCIFSEKSYEECKLRSDFDFVHYLVEAKKIVFLPQGSHSRQIAFFLDYAYSHGDMLLMLEGGGRVAGSFFDAGAIDQFFYFLCPKIFGSGRMALDGNGISNVKDAPVLKRMTAAMLGDETLISGFAE